jgi:hypothetical protein
MNNRYKSQSPYSAHMCSEGGLMRSLGLGHKAKRDCTSCSALNSPRRSLLTKCHTVSRCTRESNSIYVIRKTEAFTSRFSRRPQMITFWFLYRISTSRTINAERTDRNSFTPLKKEHTSVCQLPWHSHSPSKWLWTHHGPTYIQIGTKLWKIGQNFVRAIT